MKANELGLAVVVIWMLAEQFKVFLFGCIVFEGASESSKIFNEISKLLIFSRIHMQHIWCVANMDIY